MDQENYFRERLDEQISWYDRKSQWNQKCFKRLQLFGIVASTSIPFISGYVEYGEWVKFLIGLIGLSVAVASAVISLYKFQENWIIYRNTCESLRHEKYLFLTRTEPYDVEDPFSLLVKRAESRISQENTDWLQYMKKEIKRGDSRK